MEKYRHDSSEYVSHMFTERNDKSYPVGRMDRYNSVTRNSVLLYNKGLCAQFNYDEEEEPRLILKQPQKKQSDSQCSFYGPKQFTIAIGEQTKQNAVVEPESISKSSSNMAHLQLRPMPSQMEYDIFRPKKEDGQLILLADRDEEHTPQPKLDSLDDFKFDKPQQQNIMNISKYRTGYQDQKKKGAKTIISSKFKRQALQKMLEKQQQVDEESEEDSVFEKQPEDDENVEDVLPKDEEEEEEDVLLEVEQISLIKKKRDKGRAQTLFIPKDQGQLAEDLEQEQDEDDDDDASKGNQLLKVKSVGNLSPTKKKKSKRRKSLMKKQKKTNLNLNQKVNGLIQQSDLNLINLNIPLIKKGPILNQAKSVADLGRLLNFGEKKGKQPHKNDNQFNNKEIIAINSTPMELSKTNKNDKKSDAFAKIIKDSQMPYNKRLLKDPIFREFYQQNLQKKTIVFDIDETLVYATQNRSELKKLDEIIFIKTTKFGGMVKAYLSYRPFLFEMLNILVEDFELILYTCGTGSYASSFAESVERNGGRRYFDHILCIQHCLYSMENEIYIKDLKILEEGRNMRDILIVDNNVQSFFLQLSNGIPIYEYTGDKRDTQLPILTDYLLQFADASDNRGKIDKDFKIKKLIDEGSEQYK
ncbi:nli interacting factor-like phosphatase family protein [Stylonychia lemnae]|uniref:Nli interacting factor-like phosphatase family protein n=1 Tax=Stylonychia lemnae TaxID=5949 RepID=A0A078AUC5_STYLE|nr:nli interacting factor-like phosphatase family protein [Stylonychia lemnae]|eukprot:CDW85606.1 nli interacting factor-like phosphatase family protein [Stylonychia lemnae]